VLYFFISQANRGGEPPVCRGVEQKLMELLGRPPEAFCLFCRECRFTPIKKSYNLAMENITIVLNLKQLNRPPAVSFKTKHTKKR